jgi:hypothetical protein
MLERCPPVVAHPPWRDHVRAVCTLAVGARMVRTHAAMTKMRRTKICTLGDPAK